MADISMCSGICLDGSICPLREQCYRFLAVANDMWQSYIQPCYDEATKECYNFWDVNG